MNSMTNWLRRNIPKIVAAVIVVFLFFQARVPNIAAGERALLASRFHFSRYTLPASGDVNARTVRPVHPSLKRISAWISSVGAAIAAGDHDGDGLSNDTCLVDPRTDLVTVAPAPTTGDRYQPFSLKPANYEGATTAPMGCLIADVNEDGLADVVVYYWGRSEERRVGKECSARWWAERQEQKRRYA